MTDVTALIQELVDAGCDPVIAGSVVARAMATGASTAPYRDESLEPSAAAIRMRRYRAKRNVTSQASQSVTVTSPVTNCSLSYLPSLESKDKEERKEERKKGRGVGKPIPEDWSPNQDHLAAGTALGFSPTQVSEQAEDMRLWAQSNVHRAVARKSDWDKTFMGWLRRNRPKASDAKTLTPPNNSWAASRDRFREAYAELRAANAANEGGGGDDGKIIEFVAPARCRGSQGIHDSSHWDIREVSAGGANHGGASDSPAKRPPDPEIDFSGIGGGLCADTASTEARGNQQGGTPRTPAAPTNARGAGSG